MSSIAFSMMPESNQPTSNYDISYVISEVHNEMVTVCLSKTFFTHPSRTWLAPLVNEGLKYMKNIVFAGGSVFRFVARLETKPEDDVVHDVDAYFIMDHDAPPSQNKEGKTFIRNILKNIMKILKPSHVIVTRTTITLYGDKATDAPLQFVFQLNENCADVMHSFDLTNSRAYMRFDARGPEIITSSECFHAHRENYVGIVLDLYSPNTLDRAQKYARWMGHESFYVVENAPVYRMTEDVMQQVRETRADAFEDGTYYHAREGVKELERVVRAHLNGQGAGEATPEIPEGCDVMGPAFSTSTQDVKQVLDMAERITRFRLKRHWYMYMYATKYFGPKTMYTKKVSVDELATLVEKQEE